MTCKKCKVAMKDLKGHIYHNQRKWRCPICKRVRMQSPKSGKVRQSVFQMMRNARESDIPRLVEIRGAVRENQLRNASLVTLADYQWFIANPGMFVWEEGGRVVGFSAADPRDGSIWALFMDQAYGGRGIAQLLFKHACTVLRNVGYKRMWLTTSAGTRAEKFYRNAGWVVVSVEDGQLRFENSDN